MKPNGFGCGLVLVLLFELLFCLWFWAFVEAVSQ